MEYEDEETSRAIKAVAQSITANAIGGLDQSGAYVSSLTEAVMGMTAGLMEIAAAIRELAEVVEQRE